MFRRHKQGRTARRLKMTIVESRCYFRFEIMHFDRQRILKLVELRNSFSFPSTRLPQMPSMLVSVVGLTLAFLWTVRSVFAQTTNATCLAVYQWTSNSHKQSPCQVASSLLAVCNNGSYNVAALPDQTHYLGPDLSDANPCQCNTVVYSLMSACVSVNSYPLPIPSGTYVPGWAYFDVEANDAFDISQAKDNAKQNQLPPRSLPIRYRVAVFSGRVHKLFPQLLLRLQPRSPVSI
ncbi:hypothetical protein BD779DRAFT_1188543 [Infundibulicybe gibba]|nr:hypothetical protein BD779DRAFT_1188543 [Infundibulicybe gibba]